MKKYLEYKDDKSDKFWKIVVIDNSLIVNYGKVDYDGAIKTKVFESKKEALLEANKMISKKLKQGFKEVDQIIDYYAELEKYGIQFIETYSSHFDIDDDVTYFEDLFEWMLHDNQITEKEVEKYSERMRVFASGSGGGFRYAFWMKNKNSNCNNAPIIRCSYDWTISVFAENIKDLIKIVSYEYDIEEFEKEVLECRPNYWNFRKWIQLKLDILPINSQKEADKLEQKAINKFQKSFLKWHNKFHKEKYDK